MASQTDTTTIDIKTRIDDAALKSLITQIESAQSSIGVLTAKLNDQVKAARDAGLSEKALADFMKEAGANASILTNSISENNNSIRTWANQLNRAQAEIDATPAKITILQRKLEELGRAGVTSGSQFALLQNELKGLQAIQTGAATSTSNFASKQAQLRQGLIGTSYQLQDIAVQMQMGTALQTIALQQLPQLISGFGAFAGVVLALTAAIAAFVAIFAGPFIAEWATARKHALDYKKAIEDTDKALSALQKSSSNFSLDNLRKAFNDAEGGSRDLIVTLTRVRAAMLQLEFQKTQTAFAALTKDIGSFGALDVFTPWRDQAARMKADLDLTDKQVKRVYDTLTGLRNGTIDARVALEDLSQVAGVGASEKFNAYIQKLAEFVAQEEQVAQANSEVTKFTLQAAEAGAKGKIVIDEEAEARKKHTAELKAEKAALKDLNAAIGEYNSLLGAIQTPDEKFAQTVDQVNRLREALKGQAGVNEDVFRRIIENAEKVRDAANKEIGTKALDSYSKGVLDAATETENLQKKAEELSGALALLQNYNALGMTEQADLLAQSLGKAAPAADQVRLAVESMRDSTTGLQALSDAIDAAKEKFQLTDEEINKIREKVGLPVKTTMFDQIGEAVGPLLANGISGFVDALTSSEKSMKEWAASLIKEIGKVLIKLALLRILQAMTGTAPTGGGGGMGTNAPIAVKNGMAFGKGIGLAQGIYTKPTFFNFRSSGIEKFAAGGVVNTGVLAEAGAEAVVPLKRSSGVLGVGASPVNISIINNAGADVTATTADNQDGSKQIQIMIERQVKQGMTDGTYDAVMRQSFNLRRAAYSV